MVRTRRSKGKEGLWMCGGGWGGALYRSLEWGGRARPVVVTSETMSLMTQN
jgi:hypothetical protein